MNNTFTNYETLFESYFEMVGWDDMPRSLRLFDIRFRLALDLQIDFEGGRARVRSRGVKPAYQSLYRLVDMFNAYEAYVSYQNDVYSRSIPTERVQYRKA